MGEEAYLEEWITTITPLTTGEATFKVTFDWDEEHMGIPGAFFITNHHHTQFYLKSLTLQHVPPHGTTLFFPCNSWIYPSHRYKKDRIFFVNQVIAFSFSLYRKKLVKHLENVVDWTLKFVIGYNGC